MLQIREENPDFALGGLEGIAAVNEVLGEEDAEVTADGPGSGLGRVGRSHHIAHDLPGVFRALNNDGDHGTTGHELDEVVVKALADVFLVMLSESLGVKDADVHRHDVKVFLFEAADDLADEFPLDGIGLK